MDFYEQQQLFRQLQYLQQREVVARLEQKGVKILKRFKDFKCEVYLGKFGAKVGFRFGHVYFWYEQIAGDHWSFQESYDQAVGRSVKSYKEGMKGLEKAKALVQWVLEKVEGREDEFWGVRFDLQEV